MYNPQKVPTLERLAKRCKRQIVFDLVLLLDMKHTFYVQGVAVDFTSRTKLGKKCFLIRHAFSRCAF